MKKTIFLIAVFSVTSICYAGPLEKLAPTGVKFAWRAIRGKPIVTPEDARNGRHYARTLQNAMKTSYCRNCSGRGAIPCLGCRGMGAIQTHTPWGYKWVPHQNCGGRGFFMCMSCRGAGRK